MRKCINCKQEKELSEFYKRFYRGKFYPRSYCIDCQKILDRERRKLPERRAQQVIYSKKYYLEHKHDPDFIFKEKARDQARDRINKGQIKQLPCNICGGENVDAHHPDYNKPLEVIFLCRIHHKHEHMKMKSSQTLHSAV